MTADHIAESVAATALLDELVERLRVATYEHPMTHSHAEWKARIASMFNEFCAFCGVGESDHDGIWHEEDGSSEYTPILVYRPEHSDGDVSVD